MTINDINGATIEGKLLRAAIAVLATSERITIQGEIYNGRMLTPEWILQHLVHLNEQLEWEQKIRQS